MPGHKRQRSWVPSTGRLANARSTWPTRRILLQCGVLACFQVHTMIPNEEVRHHSYEIIKSTERQRMRTRRRQLQRKAQMNDKIFHALIGTLRMRLRLLCHFLGNPASQMSPLSYHNSSALDEPHLKSLRNFTDLVFTRIHLIFSQSWIRFSSMDQASWHVQNRKANMPLSQLFRWHMPGFGRH